MHLASPRISALLVVVAGCLPQGDVEVRSIEPDHGSVLGGTRVTITGRGLTRDASVQIGALACGDVVLDAPDRLSCTTATSHFREGRMDLVVTTGGASSTLAGAFAYECPWTTLSGRRTCGAVPPAAAAEEHVAVWLTQQSELVETDGRGTPRTIAHVGLPAIDLRDRTFKLWLKVEGIAHVSSLELLAGDAGLANMFQFRLFSPQGQPWLTDGDWVAFSVAWSEESYRVIGTPDRSAITDIVLRIEDDGTASPVRLHTNGLALVDQPSAEYPGGVVSFTFDDNYAEMVDPGAAILARSGFAATAYVIVDMVGTGGRATLDDLERLSANGWDIAVHAYTDLHHFARYPALPLTVVEDDMVDARAWLIEHGFTGYNHCAYPGGDFSRPGHDVLPLARRYFTSCRSIYQQRELYPPSDAAKLRVLYVTNTTLLPDALRAVDRAAQSGEWLIFVFHQLTARPASSGQWRAADFAKLVEHVHDVGIPVRTVSSVLEP